MASHKTRPDSIYPRHQSLRGRCCLPSSRYAHTTRSYSSTPYHAFHQTSPHSGAYTSPNSGAYTNPNSGAYTNPNSGAYTNPHSGAYTNPHSGAFTNPRPGGIPPGLGARHRPDPHNSNSEFDATGMG
jgi:hypothetical protein